MRRIKSSREAMKGYPDQFGWSFQEVKKGVLDRVRDDLVARVEYDPQNVEAIAELLVFLATERDR